MKPLFLFCTLLFNLTSTAQWSTDPALPLVVCDAPNEQRHMRAIADADSGYYVFWSDLRNDPNKAELYGQQFDSEGNALWAPNGELLLSNPIKSINQVAPLLMPDGSVIVAYMTGSTNNGADTVRAMRFDANANALWAEPSVLLTGLDYRSMKVVASDSCAYVVAYCESCGGGGYGCKMQRVRMDGTVLFPLPGQTTASNYFGPYTIHPDGAGGVLFSIRCSNGAGTCLKAQRFDSLGTAAWPAYIDLADGTGLQYAFATTMDGAGALTAVWEVAADDLRMHRVDTLGNSLWSPAVQVACDLAVYVQQDPVAVTNANELFVAWEDNRPPAANSDLYIQKYDLNTAAELWAADGVPAIQTNTYIPTTGLVLSDSGGVIVTFDGNLDGYSAMRIRNDGTQAWPAPVVFCVPSFNPFYERRVHLPDGNGGVVAFWEGSFGELYGARVYRNGKLYDDVGIGEVKNTTVINAYPNPAQDRITFKLPDGERLIQVELADVLGSISPVAADGSSIATDHLSNGTYVARLRTANAIFTARFIKH
ncbi:MAG: T9SS type A sorting domain-containing protein [Flavobacteriales bacterium]|nr:T9SS type A sorting domain-containing protein [Flavobacteriales bacterium]